MYTARCLRLRIHTHNTHCKLPKTTHIYTYVCVCMYMYTYIYTHRANCPRPRQSLDTHTQTHTCTCIHTTDCNSLLYIHTHKQHVWLTERLYVHAQTYMQKKKFCMYTYIFTYSCAYTGDRSRLRRDGVSTRRDARPWSRRAIHTRASTAAPVFFTCSLNDQHEKIIIFRADWWTATCQNGADSVFSCVCIWVCVRVYGFW